MFTFTETVSKWIAQAHPKQYVAIMSKARRVDRIYLDYQRNQRGSTSVCAYSTRARPDASVSVPLHWDELEPGRKPDFTIRNVPRRLASLRADPWKAYATTRQKLPRP
jgi:bifunctional non-homologous end joining protein LigD